jgi:FkbM family methyltransferase
MDKQTNKHTNKEYAPGDVHSRSSRSPTKLVLGAVLLVSVILATTMWNARRLSSQPPFDVLTYLTTLPPPLPNDAAALAVLQQQVEELQQQVQVLQQQQLQQQQQASPDAAPGASLRGTVVTDTANGVASRSSGVTLTDLYERFDHHPPQPRTSTAHAAVCGSAPDYAPWFAQNMTQRSANNEDSIIYKTFFKDHPPVTADDTPYTYLELGAYNGRQESNSRFFDLCLGWKGILVEANPHPVVWDQLVHNRPTAHRFHLAASCSTADALEHNASVPFHKVMWTNAAQSKGTTNAYQGGKTVDVPCGSLTPLIRDFLGGRVTFLSLDVEGAEPLVLQHVDFSELMVDVVMIENRNNFCGDVCPSRDAYRAIMEAAGYLRPKGRQVVPKSDLYVHPQSPFAKYVVGV